MVQSPFSLLNCTCFLVKSPFSLVVLQHFPLRREMDDGLNMFPIPNHIPVISPLYPIVCWWFLITFPWYPNFWWLSPILSYQHLSYQTNICHIKHIINKFVHQHDCALWILLTHYFKTILAKIRWVQEILYHLIDGLSNYS